ncbi:hypothetical protein N9933_03650 [bacterium]|nr:hypothetical protein [bacterium]
MPTPEQKIISLFLTLPLSQKAEVVAVLSKLLVEEAEDLETSGSVRSLVAEGKMDLLSEDEYWERLK